MQASIETDYLVVGAGAAGMAFTDSLLSHSDASTTITIVDRRGAPGGHWLDAYPHVRLHQPSTFYGVSSVPLGQDAIDTVGTNAGFYELAGADEIRAYFDRVMHRHFLPTGRVRYFPLSEYTADRRIAHKLTGDIRDVRVTRKVIDTTYLEGEVPATSRPPFTVADGVRCIPASKLAASTEAVVERFVVIGGGKTALDACVWLLERGVSPSAIRWIRPRDGWWINRKFQQPLSLLPDLYRGAAMQVEAMAEATSIDDLFARLEASGFFLRLDPSTTPTMFRGAVVSEAELDLLRQIQDVVRMGHVRAIEPDAIILDEGRVPTDAKTLHVHCAARGLARPAAKPIFEADRVVVQPIFWGFACYQFATLGVVEATVERDDEKNSICQPLRYWDENLDYVTAFLATMIGDRARAAHPRLAAWTKATRLNPVSGISSHRDDPRVIEARERIKRFGIAAATNLAKLMS